MIEGDRHHLRATHELQRLDLRLQRLDGKAGEAVVFGARRRVLQDDGLRLRRGEDLQPTGVRRVHQAALSLDDDGARALLFPRRDDRVLELPGDEVVDQRVEQDPVLRPLEPRRLPGPDELGGVPQRAERVDEDPGGRPLADRRVRAQHRDAQGSHLTDAAGEGVERAPLGRPPHVAQALAVLRRERGDLRDVGEVVVEPGVHVEAGADRLAYGVELAGLEAPAVRCDAEDEVGGAGAAAARRHRVSLRPARPRIGTPISRPPIERLARVPAGRGPIDHRLDAVAARAPHQAVGRLPQRRGEGPICSTRERDHRASRRPWTSAVLDTVSRAFPVGHPPSDGVGGRSSR